MKSLCLLIVTVKSEPLWWAKGHPTFFYNTPRPGEWLNTRWMECTFKKGRKSVRLGIKWKHESRDKWALKPLVVLRSFVGTLKERFKALGPSHPLHIHTVRHSGKSKLFTAPLGNVWVILGSWWKGMRGVPWVYSHWQILPWIWACIYALGEG